MQPTHLTALLAAALLAGCSSGYRYRFGPSPLEVLVPENDPEPFARALVSVRGARRAERDGPLEMHVRLRVENRGEEPLELLHEEFQLVAADLEAFGAPRTDPDPLPVLQPGEERRIETWFPFPEGFDPSDLDLEAVNFRWGFAYGDRTWWIGSNFERLRKGDGVGYGVIVGGGYYSPGHIHVIDPDQPQPSKSRPKPSRRPEG